MMLNDLKHAIRLLFKNPGFAAVAVLTLALGIGANTAIYSVVDNVLLRPLPYPDPERLVVIWENDRLRGTTRERASYPDFQDMRAQLKSFGILTGWNAADVTLTGTGTPERIVMARVSPNYLDLLGIAPALGRGLNSSDPTGVLISRDLWHRRFGADSNAIGKQLRIDGVGYTVVGVAPASALLPGNTEDIWAPLVPTPTSPFRGMHNIRVYARLSQPLASANAELSTFMAALERAYADDNTGRGAWASPIHEELTGPVRTPLLVLLTAVAFLLLIACANVASLLLTRITGRSRELAIRIALGAGRMRLVSQLLVENAVLTGLGAIGGVSLAAWIVDLLRTKGPANIPRLDAASLDPSVLAFALGVSAVAWLLVSIAPLARRHDLTLRESSGSTGQTRQLTRQFLVAAEVALCVVLVIGAGLLARSYLRLASVDAGFQPSNLLTMGVQLPSARYPGPDKWPFLKWPQVTNFQSQLLERLRSTPGVESAALGLAAPTTGTFTTRFTIAGRPAAAPGKQDEMFFRPVTHGYFDTIRMPIRAGRPFTAQDDSSHPLVAIASESFVKRYLPGEDPIGKRVNLFGHDREIVGVAASEKFLGLDQDAPPAIYLPFEQNPLNSLTLIVRTAGDPMLHAQAIQRQIWSLDPELAIADLTTVEASLAASMANRQFTTALLLSFAVAALLLSAIGIYGVVSFAVTQRTREIGIRMALGAKRSNVVGMVVRQSAVVICAGLLIGTLAAAGLAKLVETQLFGITRYDPLTFALAPALLLSIAAMAAWKPARTASRVDPLVALKYE